MVEIVEEFCWIWGDDYFSFWVGGVLFLVFNFQFYENFFKCFSLKQVQDQWLDEQLSIVRQWYCQYVIVFQYILLFLESIDEDDDYYFNFSKFIWKKLVDKFIYVGVRVVFLGYYYRNVGGIYQNFDMVVLFVIGCQLGRDFYGF